MLWRTARTESWVVNAVRWGPFPPHSPPLVFIIQAWGVPGSGWTPVGPAGGLAMVLVTWSVWAAGLQVTWSVGQLVTGGQRAEPIGDRWPQEFYRGA